MGAGEDFIVLVVATGAVGNCAVVVAAGCAGRGVFDISSDNSPENIDPKNSNNEAMMPKVIVRMPCRTSMCGMGESNSQLQFGKLSFCH